MRTAHLLAFTFILLLSACQPAASPTITLIADDQIHTLQTSERVPSALLEAAGIVLQPSDTLLLNGLPISPDQPISTHPITLQVRRARTVPLSMPEGEQKIVSSAFTVGEALEGTDIRLRAGDRITPGSSSPLPTGRDTISLVPAREVTITTNTGSRSMPSAARTVGEALAEAGIPLIGLDYSQPAADEPVPADGQIRVVRVSEDVQLALQPVPFESELQASADVPLDTTQILQPGEPGLTMQRIRIRYEDGQEISRVAEDETLVRPPQTRVLAYGTKIEVKTATVDGVQIEYWRAVPMYATSYSPCRSGTDRCYPGTASGQTLRKGMVAVRYSWYLNMQGQRLYIPGYGFATVEDVCGGCVGRPWIDLGFSDNNFEPWHNWVTVYFLTPVPSNVVPVLE
jgi:uncharacterized protein YabE (DUF348 family)